MSFGSPHLLWLLLVLPPGLAVFFWFSLRQRERLMEQFIQARLLPVLTSGISALRRKLKLGLLVLSAACLIVALARPQWGFSWQEVKQRGVDIVVAIDVSKSMLTQDIAPNRLARAKLAALELMQKARTDRLGLVAFAGSAFLACPLTIDDAAFSQSVESLSVNSVSEGGTAIADAIEAALPAFKEEDNQKVLVLMTDGEDHDSGALEAAQKGAASGLKIYTIGVGTPKGDLIRVTDAQGKSDYVRDEDGNVVQSHLDEDLLRRIAGASDGGFYLPLQGAKTIATLYDDPSHGLGGLRKTEHQEKLVKQFHQRYHWPLAFAILFLVAEILIPERRRETTGRAAMSSSRRNVLPGRAPRDGTVSALSSRAVVVLISLCVVLMSQGGFAASPSQALRDYKEGKYDQALKEYQQLMENKKDDPRLHFNAGAAAYRNGQFDQAIKQFEAASSSPDLKLQELSYYNRANSLFWAGEQNADSKKRIEQWEQALKDYDLSLKMNPQDGDAKFNQEFVKRKLEELKQQQQQNQQSNQDKKDQQQQDQKDQSQQNNQQQQQNQDRQSQQNQSQQQQNQQSQSQDQQNQQQQQQSQSQNQQQQQSQQQQSQAEQNQKQQQQQQMQQQQAEHGDEDKKQGDKQEQMAAAQQMSQKQAEQLLDAQKGKEKVLTLNPQQTKPVDPKRKLKDW